MVSEVLPNGNLVEGRQLSLTEGAEFIQIRGVVRARDVQPDNTVSSMRMARAQISYREPATWLNRSTGLDYPVAVQILAAVNGAPAYENAQSHYCLGQRLRHVVGG